MCNNSILKKISANSQFILNTVPATCFKRLNNKKVRLHAQFEKDLFSVENEFDCASKNPKDPGILNKVHNEHVIITNCAFYRGYQILIILLMLL